MLFETYGQYFQGQIVSEMGRSTVLPGIYFKPSLNAAYTWNNYSVMTGLQLLFPGEGISSQIERKRISGWQASFSRGFSVSEFPFVVQVAGVINPYSDLVRESNYLLLVSHIRNHLTLRIGNSTRIYRALDEGNASTVPAVEGKKRIIEYRNLVYQFTASLRTMEKSWNVGVGLTNIDNFRVQQETNPMFYITGMAAVSDQLVLNLESWLLRAGMSNLAADSYGWYLKLGILWMLYTGN